MDIWICMYIPTSIGRSAWRLVRINIFQSINRGRLLPLPVGARSLVSSWVRTNLRVHKSVFGYNSSKTYHREPRASPGFGDMSLGRLNLLWLRDTLNICLGLLVGHLVPKSQLSSPFSLWLCGLSSTPVHQVPREKSSLDVIGCFILFSYAIDGAAVKLLKNSSGSNI